MAGVEHNGALGKVCARRRGCGEATGRKTKGQTSQAAAAERAEIAHFYLLTGRWESRPELLRRHLLIAIFLVILHADRHLAGTARVPL
jgi:hypothetical protein